MNSCRKTMLICAAGTAALWLLTACGGPAETPSPSVPTPPDEFLDVCPTPEPGAPILSDEERAANARAAVLAHSGVPEEEIVLFETIIDDSL